MTACVVFAKYDQLLTQIWQCNCHFFNFAGTLKLWQIETLINCEYV